MPQKPPPPAPDHQGPETPQLLTVPEAAARLGVSQRTVEQLIAEGELPLVRVRRRTRRISASAITEFVRRKTRWVH